MRFEEQCDEFLTEKDIYDDIYSIVLHYIMTQYALKKGLKTLGEHGEAAFQKKMTQLNLWDTFKPIKKDLLFPDKQVKAIALLVFLTDKSDVSIQDKPVQM